MNIIISGGWGYRNLGDDAILLASIDILTNIYPEASITVLSYNVDETSSVLKNFRNVEVCPSLHVCLFGYTPHRSYVKPKYVQKPTTVQLACNRVKSFIYNLYHTKPRSKTNWEEFEDNRECFIKENLDKILPFRTLCEKSAIYVMSGGGYLNGWYEMTVSKLIEVKVAKDLGLKCFSIGQSLGVFWRPQHYSLTKEIFTMMDGFFFRDKESNEYIASWNLPKKDVVPDLALSQKQQPELHREEKIVLIPGDVTHSRVLDDVVKIAKEKNLMVQIITTQQWNDTIHNAVNVFSYLREGEISVDLIVPSNVFELQTLLSKAKLIISTSFHGLVMGYRSQTPIINMTDYPKLNMLMDMIGKSEMSVYPECAKDNELYQKCHQCLCEEWEYIDFNPEIMGAINETLGQSQWIEK